MTPRVFAPYLARALPWASRSTGGTPSRTKRVKRDCSMLENFWKAMFLITGGSWWWSPIMMHRFRRLKLSSGFYNRQQHKVSWLCVTVFSAGLDRQQHNVSCCLILTLCYSVQCRFGQTTTHCKLLSATGSVLHSVQCRFGQTTTQCKLLSATGSVLHSVQCRFGQTTTQCKLLSATGSVLHSVHCMLWQTHSFQHVVIFICPDYILLISVLGWDEDGTLRITDLQEKWNEGFYLEYLSWLLHQDVVILQATNTSQ